MHTIFHCLVPSKEEIQEQIRNLKTHKAPGEDNIPGELLKTMGNSLLEYVSGLIKEVWEKEVIPEEWQIALIYPIHKKGDKQVTSYKGIALLNVTYKVLSKCTYFRGLSRRF